MTNPKALAVTERAALSNTVFENPELTAMAAICELLQELPDDAARLRVMHWSFGRFNPEFKRPAPAPIAVPARIAPVAPVASAQSPLASERAAGADADFSDQLSELADLFAGDLHRRRTAFADAF